MAAVTYYPQQPGGWPPPQPQGAWPPPHQPQGGWPPSYPPRFPQPRPGGGTAITAACVALALALYTAWPVILLIDPLVGRCGESCFTGFLAVGVIALPLAALLLVAGAITTFVRAVAGPVMTAIGATAVLAVVLMSIVLSHGHLGVITILGLVLSRPVLVLSLLPPTYAWIRAKPRPVAYPPRY